MRPNCVSCQHYYCTWNKAKPHGCKLFAIECSTTPSNVVKQKSGHDCRGFEQKKKKGPQKERP